VPGLLPIQVSRSPCPGSLLPEAAGAHCGPAGGRRGLPDPPPCPGSPLPVEAAILTMIEWSTLILAPARAGRAASKKHIWYYDVTSRRRKGQICLPMERIEKLFHFPSPGKQARPARYFLGDFLYFFLFLFIMYECVNKHIWYDIKTHLVRYKNTFGTI